MRAPIRRAAGSAFSVAMIAAAVVLVVGLDGKRGGSGVAVPWLPSTLRQMTHLSPMPAHPAPPFTLTDQRGRRVALASLRGKVVVMQPMDPECVDICPLVAQEFVDAARDLGRNASSVVFLGLNVNARREGIANVNAFSREHGLDRLATWHFLTGPTATLKSLWRAYMISVEINHAGEVVHSAPMYFIDPQGRWRWFAMPQVERLAIPQWGHMIADVAEHLLAARR
jgi:cytochrome oxidase Cu insertion factor (SCO1/SenC/PrrC family)